MGQLKLVNLLKEEEPKKGSSQFPGKYHLGGGFYSSKEGGEAEFKSEDGKLKPLTPDEKAAHKAKTGGKPLGPPPIPNKKPTGPPPIPGKKPNGPPPIPGRKQVPPMPAKKPVGPPPIPGRKQLPPPPPKVPTTPTEPKKQGFFSKAKEGLQNWSKEEKKWFTDKVHKGNSPERRSFSQAVKHKLKGAVQAAWEGAKHEAHTFKEAGTGLYNFFALKDVTPSQKKALVSVAKKVAVTAATSVAIAATGGVAGVAAVGKAGAGAFLKHVAIEFVPHITAETLAVGAGRAALFAGDEEKDPEKLMEKFMDMITDKLATEEIPTEILLKAVESYNAEKAESGEAGINKETLNIKELKREIKEAFTINNEIKKELKRYKLK